MVVSAAVAPGVRAARPAWRLSANVNGVHRIISKGNAGLRSRQPSLRKLPTRPRAIAEADKPSTGNSTGSNISIEIDNATESKETLIIIHGANRAGEERKPTKAELPIGSLLHSSASISEYMHAIMS